MFRKIVIVIYIFLWIFSNIRGISTEPPSNKHKRVLPSFYGINVYHRVRDGSKLKPMYGPPPKTRIFNQKPNYRPQKFSDPSPSCNNLQHSVSTFTETEDVYIPNDFEQDLTPPQNNFKDLSSFEAPREVTDELRHLILKHPDFFEDHSPTSLKTIPYSSRDSFHNPEHLHIPSFNNPPLVFDPMRSSYDTPGAVTSYGTPVQHQQYNFDNQQHQNNVMLEDNKQNSYSENVNENFPDIYDFYKGPDSFTTKEIVKYSVPKPSQSDKLEDYFAVNFNIDYLNDHKKRGTHEAAAQENQGSKMKSIKDFQEIRYPNHRYEE